MGAGPETLRGYRVVDSQEQGVIALFEAGYQLLTGGDLGGGYKTPGGGLGVEAGEVCTDTGLPHDNA